MPGVARHPPAIRRGRFRTRPSGGRLIIWSSRYPGSKSLAAKSDFTRARRPNPGPPWHGGRIAPGRRDSPLNGALGPLSPGRHRRRVDHRRGTFRCRGLTRLEPLPSMLVWHWPRHGGKGILADGPGANPNAASFASGFAPTRKYCCTTRVPAQVPSGSPGRSARAQPSGGRVAPILGRRGRCRKRAPFALTPAGCQVGSLRPATAGQVGSSTASGSCSGPWHRLLPFVLPPEAVGRRSRWGHRRDSITTRPSWSGYGFRLPMVALPGPMA